MTARLRRALTRAIDVFRGTPAARVVVVVLDEDGTISIGSTAPPPLTRDFLVEALELAKHDALEHVSRGRPS